MKNILSIKEHNKHMMFFRDSILTQLYWEDSIPIEKGTSVYTYNDNRNINDSFDSNTLEDWNNRFMFNFGTLK